MNLEEFYKHHNSGYSQRLLLAILLIVFSSIYFSWRITVMNQSALFFSITLFSAELFCLVIIIFTLFVSWRLKERETVTPRPGLKVDVFIPTWNEEIDIVRITVLGSTKINYPHQTWILDDGNRPEFRQLADEFDCRYLARQDKLYAKAGNLNNALNQSEADFIALLDADHVPEEDFLDKLLGYFNDPDVAFVQSPQAYYNINSIQFQNNKSQKVLWHDQTFFYMVGQAGRDYWNATTLCGTSCIIRRSALDSIGGFVTGGITEDMQTAVKLHKSGYKSVYHPEPLAHGIAAADFAEFLEQRLRWGYGNIQTLIKERIPFCKGLTFPQALSYIALGLEFTGGWPRIIFYLTPVIILIGGASPVSETHYFLWFFSLYFLSAYFCMDEFGRGNNRFFISEQIEMARFPVSILATIGAFFNLKYEKIKKILMMHRSPVFLITPYLIVLVFSTTALLVGILSPPGSIVLLMSDGILAFICLWALINSFLAASVIYTVLIKSKSEKECRYEIVLPVSINLNKRRSLKGKTSKISVNGMIYTGSFGLFPEINDIINCELKFNDIHISVDAKIDSVELIPGSSDSVISCVFIWSDTNTRCRDLLGLKLHACNWYHKVTWNQVYMKTLLDRISCINFSFVKNEQKTN